MITSIEIRNLAVREPLCSGNGCMSRCDIRANISPEYISELQALNVKVIESINWAISDLAALSSIIKVDRNRYKAISMQPLDAALESVLDSAEEIYVDSTTGDICEIVYQGTAGIPVVTINRILHKLGKTVFDYPNASIVA